MKNLIIDILKKSKKELIIKTITSLFVQGLLLVIPIYWSKSINYLSENLINKSFYMVLIVLILSILQYGWEYLNQRSWFTFYDKMYSEYINIVTNKKNDYDDITLAEFTNIVNNDIDIICNFISNSITRFIQILEFLFIYIYFLSVNVYIFVVTLSISIIMIFLLIVSGNLVQNSNIKRKNSLDKKTIFAHSFFEKYKSKDKEKFASDLNDATSSYLKADYNYNLLIKQIIYIVLASISVCRYGIIFYSIYLVSQGQIEIGTILLIYTYYAKIITNFEMLGTISADYRSFVVSLKRLNRIK